MKTKFIIFFLCTIFLSTSLKVSAQTKSFYWTLTGYIKSKAETSVANDALSTANQVLNAKEPGLIIKKEEEEAIGDKIIREHNNKHEEGSNELKNWRNKLNAAKAAAEAFQNQIDNLHETVDKAQTQKNDAEAKMKDWHQKLVDLAKEKISANCAEQLSSDSPIEAIVNCWNGFFDGATNDYPALPRQENPGSIKASPNGAPGVFSVLSDRQKESYRVGNRTEPPAPIINPPQKGVVEQATNKIRSYFRDVIEKSQRLKRRLVQVVPSVRG